MSQNFESPSSNDTPAWLDWFGWQVPVAILVLTLLGTNMVQFVKILDARSTLTKNKEVLLRDDVKKQLAEAQQTAKTLDALVRGVVDLSATDANAKKIVDEFQIRVNAPQGGAPAAR
ncbi:hypothetical protein SAMN05444156_3048 [Verrucomicrobium sp. GAS474]|uniref:hypothetical protein n=1 Tax=Verrucomicrobium sp. GAS474 TaxID=1882831 RepID=UPI00087DC2D3|nr:hypothetical protein [Verrucomicrobium sp. GAS474]SDU28265.1 hypothetical protein SAMN05444156_3048 [Verrucomicrobium sp. GAS474]